MTEESADLTRPVIGAALTVLNTLRPGLDAGFYTRALVIELRRQGIHCGQDREYEVFYDGEVIGAITPGLVVEDLLIVEVRVVPDFDDSQIAQMQGILNIAGIPTGLLLNFKYPKLGIKRVSRALNF
ncbi:MAG: GxxExxY protein [Verrucomicrobiota bacterium]